jgi:hypothetical protein
MPPDIWCGYSSSRRSGDGMPHAAQHLDRLARGRRAATAVGHAPHDLGDLVADA